MEGLISDNLATGWAVTLAWHDDQLVGFSAIKLQDKWLDQLFILPDYQGMEIGLALLNMAMQAMPEGFTLRTAKSNGRAHRFYRQNGLREIGEVVSPYRGVKSIVFAWP